MSRCPPGPSRPSAHDCHQEALCYLLGVTQQLPWGSWAQTGGLTPRRAPVTIPWQPGHTLKVARGGQVLSAWVLHPAPGQQGPPAWSSLRWTDRQGLHVQLDNLYFLVALPGLTGKSRAPQLTAGGLSSPFLHLPPSLGPPPTPHPLAGRVVQPPSPSWRQVGRKPSGQGEPWADPSLGPRVLAVPCQEGRART